MKYANIPKFQYQKVDGGHYQTFDRQSLTFITHPIVPKPTVSLPLSDNTEVADTEPDKGDVEQTTEESKPVSSEESPSTENDGELNYSKYLSLIF
jgi:hypothetical protein